mmetsp:Transcript_35260/g.109305  ORF Transcript_35260/g.109305 Transcript_35260/m.109305 type:complete len:167 (-) Transcript_35260:173-673(-)
MASAAPQKFEPLSFYANLLERAEKKEFAAVSRAVRDTEGKELRGVIVTDEDKIIAVLTAAGQLPAGVFVTFRAARTEGKSPERESKRSRRRRQSKGGSGDIVASIFVDQRGSRRRRRRFDQRGLAATPSIRSKGAGGNIIDSIEAHGVDSIEGFARRRRRARRVPL